METELKECGEKTKKDAIIFACLFSCCPAYDFFFLCPYSDCLGALCVFFFFSVADHNGGAKPRVKRRGVVWESKREPLRCLLDQQVTGWVLWDSAGDVGCGRCKAEHLQARSRGRVAMPEMQEVQTRNERLRNRQGENEG